MAPQSKKTANKSTTCPWCSASVPAVARTCPSCGASLHEPADTEILGVTQIDPAAISRAARINPGRLASWLGAERAADSADLGGRIEPPSPEVRQEMLRIRLAAIEAELETQAAQAAAQRDLLASENAGEAAASARPAASAGPAASGDAPSEATASQPDASGADATAGDAEAKPG